MRTTVFELSRPEVHVREQRFGLMDEVFYVPTLPAYAILNHRLEYRSSMWGLDYKVNYEVEDSCVKVIGVKQKLPMEVSVCSLTVHYAGIRDYSLLFPSVNDLGLRGRLGELAEEADNAFHSGAWMSFTIMAISAMEGLLISELGVEGTLSELIKKALQHEVINESESMLLHNAREVRNRIHAGRYAEPLADRSSGTDLYVLFDRLIKKDWKLLGPTRMAAG